MQPILSILIPVHPSHEHFLKDLLDNLYAQIGRLDDIDSVEVIYSINGTMSTGAHRNFLLDSAIGQHIAFCDSDDEVADYYVEEILKALEPNPDCVATYGRMTTDGRNPIEWYLAKDNPNTTIQKNGRPFYLRKTNHLSPVKRELALLARFPDKSNGEDKDYSDRLSQFLKTETTIEKPIYFYRYVSTNKTYS